jgi:hypothetical protein
MVGSVQKVLHFEPSNGKPQFCFEFLPARLQGVNELLTIDTLAPDSTKCKLILNRRDEAVRERGWPEMRTAAPAYTALGAHSGTWLLTRKYIFSEAKV